MYQAELRGKLSSRTEQSEDILTSNVFSFFEYSNRQIFLRGYLAELGFPVSPFDADAAEFVFWPTFEDNTEPDLRILVGNTYLLFEVKYFSDFGKETERLDYQLVREISGGRQDAANQGKKVFKLIAITADYCYQAHKFEHLDRDLREKYVIWTNWQKISSCLRRVLESDVRLELPERLFASDLLELLEKKKLRSYEGQSLFGLGGLQEHAGNICAIASIWTPNCMNVDTPERSDAGTPYEISNCPA